MLRLVFLSVLVTVPAIVARPYYAEFALVKFNLNGLVEEQAAKFAAALNHTNILGPEIRGLLHRGAEHDDRTVRERFSSHASRLRHFKAAAERPLLDAIATVTRRLREFGNDSQKMLDDELVNILRAEKELKERACNVDDGRIDAYHRDVNERAMTAAEEVGIKLTAVAAPGATVSALFNNVVCELNACVLPEVAGAEIVACLDKNVELLEVQEKFVEDLLKVYVEYGKGILENAEEAVQKWFERRTEVLFNGIKNTSCNRN